MMPKRPEKDLDNPPGQIINPIPPTHFEQPLSRMIDEYVLNDGYRSALALESLCAWLLHRFGPDTPEGREALCRLSLARKTLSQKG